MPVVCALALAAAAAAQPAAAPRHVAVVRVDVIAADARGRSVDTLKPSDFELRENGVLQSLDEVVLVKADGRGPAAVPVASDADERAEASSDGARVFAILLDEYHVRPEATAAVRAAVSRLIDELGPRDLVALMKPLDSILAIRATRDRAVLKASVASFEGRRGDYEPKTAFERSYLAGTPARIEQARAQVTTSALNALAAHVGGLGRGRKTIVLVSEGFDPPSRGRGLERLPTIDGVIRAANRYNVSIYPLDLSAGAAHVTAAGADEGADDPAATLRRLADETAGTTSFGPADPDAAIGRILRDSSAYYLLSYHSAHDNDGQFRRVDVRVRSRGVVLRARKGYWALFPDEALAAKIAAEGLPAPPKPPPGFDEPWHASPFIRPWFGVARGPGGRTRVTFVWEPAPRLLGDRSRRREPAHVVLTALAADGTKVFEGPVEPTAAGALSDADADRAARAVFDVAPGRLRIRIAIEDEMSKRIDADIREIAIRDQNAPVVLGTPAILRARSAVEFRALARDWEAPPVAAREFTRTEHVIVRTAAFAVSGHLTVGARLLNRSGQAMRTLTVRPGVDLGAYQLDLSLGGLAPSEYQIEISASAAGHTAKELVRFRVIG